MNRRTRNLPMLAAKQLRTHTFSSIRCVTHVNIKRNKAAEEEIIFKSSSLVRYISVLEIYISQGTPHFLCLSCHATVLSWVVNRSRWSVPENAAAHFPVYISFRCSEFYIRTATTHCIYGNILAVKFAWKEFILMSKIMLLCFASSLKMNRDYYFTACCYCLNSYIFILSMTHAKSAM